MDKRLLMILLFGLLIGSSLQIPSALAATAWVYEPSNTTNDLRAVRALSSDVAIAVGANGIIKKTTNKGYTWLTKASGTTNKLEDIAITGSVGWAVGVQGTILKTSKPANLGRRKPAGRRRPFTQSIKYPTPSPSSSARAIHS